MSKVFVREATGLVRQFSHLDLFVQAVSIMQIGISVLFFLESVGGYFPGTNFFGVYLFGGLVALAFAGAWSIMSAAMPRTGGDYIWLTRVLPKVPAVGFTYAITYGLGFAVAFNMGFQVWLFANGVLAPTFAGLGLVYNIPSLVAFGQWMVAGNGLFITGLVLVALAILSLSVGISLGNRIINILFFFSFAVTILWIALGFVYGQADFQKAFDGLFGGGQYQNVLKLGQTAGFSGFSTNILATLQVGFSIGYFAAYSNFQYPVWASGEIKRADQVWKPYTVAIVVTGLMYVLLILSFFNLMGQNWVGAVSSAAANSQTSGSLPFSVPPTFTLFLTVMFRDNAILVFLINAGLIAGTWTWFVVPYIAFSRLIFSLSFDRLLPKAFADVNARLRIPFKALGLSAVLVVLWFSQYVYGLFFNPNLVSFATVFFSVAAVAPAAWAVAGLVFALFPWLNPSLYKSLPAPLRRNIGLPIITWLGGFVAVTQAYAVFVYITVAAPIPIIAESAILTIMLGSFLGYYVIKAVRKNQGIDLGLVFAQIPPE